MKLLLSKYIAGNAIIMLLLCIVAHSTAFSQLPKLMLPLSHTGSILDIQQSRDGKFFATSSLDKTVKLWDNRTGKLLYTFSNFSRPIGGMAFHPGSRHLLISCDSVITEYDIFTAKITHTIKAGKPVRQCAYNSDGSLIAFKTGLWEDIINLYDYKKGKLLQSAKLHTDYPDKLQFTADSKYLVTSQRDQVAILEVPTLQQKAKLDFPRDSGVSEVMIHPSGKKIGIFQHEGLFFYSLPQLKLLSKITQNREVDIFMHGAYNVAGDRFVTANANNKMQVWDDASRKLLTEVYYVDTSGNDILIPAEVRYDPSGKKLLLVAAFIESIHMFNIDGGKELFRITKSTPKLNSAKFDISGSMIVTASDDDKIKIWSTSVGRPLATLSGHTDAVNTAAYGLKANIMVSSGYDRTARVWDWTQQKLLRTIKLPGYGRMNVSLSSDTKQLLTLVHADSNAYVWDITTGNLVKKLHHDNWVSYGTYSLDGKLLATADFDGRIKIWNAADCSLLREIDAHDRMITSVNFHTNSELLISSSVDSTAKIWQASTGKCLVTVKLPTTSITHAAFSYTEKKIVLACTDKTAKVFDIKGERLLFTLEGHTDELVSAEFSFKTNKIITLSKDNTMKLWDGETGKLVVTYIPLQGGDYLTITPEGYYMASPGAARKLHYVTNDLTTISFDQLDLRFNRPDKVAEALGNRSPEYTTAYRNAYYKRLKKAGIDTAAFNNNNYTVPVVSIVNANDIRFDQTSGSLRVEVKAFDSKVPLKKVNLWVNEVPLGGIAGTDLGGYSKEFTGSAKVDLTSGLNIIEVSVVNTSGVESYRSSVTVNYLPAKPPEEKVYFIGIGINRYKEDGHTLNWSVKDIRDITANFRKKFGNSLVVDTLFDENVSVANVFALKEKLKKLGIEDKVVFAFSGHGLLSKDFDYYLATYDVDFNNPENGGKGILYDDLEKMFDNIQPRRKLMLVDACHSGEIDKDEVELAEKQKDELAKKGVKGVTLTIRPAKKAGLTNTEILQHFFANVSRSTGTTIISAAAGTQYALERGDLMNGVFTACFIEAMNTYKTITVQKLKRYVTSKVVELTKGLQRPNSRTETNLVDWSLW